MSFHTGVRSLLSLNFASKISKLKSKELPFVQYAKKINMFLLEDHLPTEAWWPWSSKTSHMLPAGETQLQIF